MKTLTKLRIFVASPSDVATESQRLRHIVDQLNRHIAHQLGLCLEVIDWQTIISPSTGRPEEITLQQLPVDKWDIFVGILWLRFGTPVIDTQSGRVFHSGTHEEFSLAYNAWKEYERPTILFYRCMRPPRIDDIDPDQLKLIKSFFAEFEINPESEKLYRKFDSPDEFENILRNDLTKLLTEYSQAVSSRKHNYQSKLPTSKTHTIFISYRRQDSADVTGRIYDRLVDHFGKDTIFKDVDSVPLGIDFRKFVDEKIGNCQIFIVIIGDQWLSLKNSSGKRRIDDPTDIVRLEVETALKHDIPIIPLLVKECDFLSESDLPTEIKNLAYRNAISIRHDPDFHIDMDRLIRGIEYYGIKGR